jgi:microcystin degradation protein MlrC
LIQHEIRDSAVILNDPQGVRALRTLRPGQRTVLAIGGRGSRLDLGPVPLELELISISDGRFYIEDPQSHLASMRGRQIDMGPCAVVRHQNVTILLTSRKTPPFDLGQWRSQGIEPTRFFAIGVKAAVAHKRAYDPITRHTFYIDTPGPCSSNLRRFPYEKVRRPIFPLDPV